MNQQTFLDKTIVHLGEVWTVIGVGAKNESKTFCLLANTKRGKQQKNGFMPVQINDWIDTEILTAAQ